MSAPARPLNPDFWLPLPIVAGDTGTSETKLRGLIEDGKIPAKRDGPKLIRIRPADVNRYYENLNDYEPKGKSRREVGKGDPQVGNTPPPRHGGSGEKDRRPLGKEQAAGPQSVPSKKAKAKRQSAEIIDLSSRRSRNEKTGTN